MKHETGGEDRNNAGAILTCDVCGRVCAPRDALNVIEAVHPSEGWGRVGASVTVKGFGGRQYDVVLIESPHVCPSRVCRRVAFEWLLAEMGEFLHDKVEWELNLHSKAASDEMKVSLNAEIEDEE